MKLLRKQKGKKTFFFEFRLVQRGHEMGPTDGRSTTSHLGKLLSQNSIYLFTQ